MTDAPPTDAGPPLAAAAHDREPVDVDLLLDRAVAGVPRWRRARTRRELAGYVEDAFAELTDEGLDSVQALDLLQARFGDPELVAAGFRSLPPPRWARGMGSSAGPLSAVVLGLVMGLALLQMRAPVDQREPVQAQMAVMYLREVSGLSTATAAPVAGATVDYRVTSRLGLARSGLHVLEPSVPALTPAWLPEGFDPDRGALFLTSSATVQFFGDSRGDRPGIVVEVLRPDRSTVFQVKERHVFPLWVGMQPGFYIDGEWEVRGPQDEQSAPATWRTDRSRSLLFTHDGLLVLVAGPADVVGVEDLIRIALSLR